MNRPHSRSTICVSFIVLTLFLLLWAWHLGLATIWQDNKTLATGGDGYGTISWIYDIQERHQNHDPTLFSGDFYWSDNVGLGHTHPNVINIYWRAMYAFLGDWMSPDNIYDTVTFLTFLLNGLSAFGFALMVGLSIPASAAFALLIDNHEIFAHRSTSHIGLLTLYPIIIAGICWARFVKRPSIGSSLLFGTALTFMFLGNEYYGYFGLIFYAAATGIALLLCPSLRPLDRKEATQTAGRLAIMLGSFIGLMAICYPTIVRAKILRHLPLPLPINPTTGPIQAPVAYSLGTFDFFSVRSFGQYFATNSDWIGFLNKGVPGKFWEFSYGVGLLIPLFGLLFVLSFWIRKWRGNRTEKPDSAVSLLTSLLVAAFFCLLFTLQPGRHMSLIRLTAKFAPQFRVACRGTLLPDIAFLIIFAGLLDKCILWVKNKSWFPGRIRDYSLLIIGFIVLLTAVVDAKPYMSFALPNPLVQTTMLDKHDKPYELLAPLPYARLVELPFYCEPCGDAPEYDYPYMLRRMLHHKPILNYLRDPQYDAPIKKMAQSLNGFSPEAWRLMYRLGVRYVTINKIEMARKEPKRSFESFPLPAQTIFESDELKILRLTGDVEKSQIPSAEQSLDSILRF